MRRYSLRDNQWQRIKDLLPVREGYVGDTAANNRLLMEGSCIATARAFHGATFLPVSATGKTCTGVCAAGVKAVSLNGYFVIWVLITTANT